MAAQSTARISPTAHYTGYVWCHHGLSPPALATVQGRLMFHGLRPVARLASLGTGGATLETFLLQRHRIIDHLLDRAITAGRIGQVVEIAGGLSGRGWRLARRHRDAGLVYVEGDLTDMALRKRGLLERAGLRSAHHHVVALDVLVAEGALGLGPATAELLDRSRGTALITEGLLTYFDRPTVLGMWQRFAQFLAGFPEALYLSDAHLADQANSLPVARVFLQVLRAFAGRRIHLHFTEAEALEAALKAAGFASSRLHDPRDLAGTLDLPRSRGADFVRVLEARLP